MSQMGCTIKKEGWGITFKSSSYQQSAQTDMLRAYGFNYRPASKVWDYLHHRGDEAGLERIYGEVAAYFQSKGYDVRGIPSGMVLPPPPDELPEVLHFDKDHFQVLHYAGQELGDVWQFGYLSRDRRFYRFPARQWDVVAAWAEERGIPITAKAAAEINASEIRRNTLPAIQTGSTLPPADHAPLAVSTTLMDHQQQAVDWLAGRDFGMLAMDMGTGKSLTAIEMARLWQAAGQVKRVIWLTPVSLKRNIRGQILEHTGERPEDVHCWDLKVTPNGDKSSFWQVVGIESVGATERVTLGLAELATPDTLMLVDESLFIKNDRAKRTKRITALGRQCGKRLCLTGTLTSQGIEDLYGQYQFLSSAILGYRSWFTFARAHLTVEEGGRVVQRRNVERLIERMAPFTFQITKEECLDLLPKVHQDRDVSLTRTQKKLYEEAKRQFAYDIQHPPIVQDRDGNMVPEEGSITLWRMISQLRSISNGIMPVGFEGAGEPIEENKTAELISIAESLPDERLIVWVKYLKSAEHVSEALQAAFPDRNVSPYHGGMSEHGRDASLQRWREDGGFLVATPGTGGFGLTLTEARYVVFYTSDYRYSEHLQAEDRIQRIGQKRQAVYISLWAECGIEGRVRQALSFKAASFDLVRSLLKEQKGASSVKKWLSSI